MKEDIRTVYKVVRKRGRVWRSCVMDNVTLTVDYRIGKKVYPHEGTYIYAFDRFMKAHKFMSGLRARLCSENKYTILVCKAGVAPGQPRIWDVTGFPSAILHWWRRIMRKGYDSFFFGNVPDGTVWCNWVIPKYVYKRRRHGNPVQV